MTEPIISEPIQITRRQDRRVIEEFIRNPLYFVLNVFSPAMYGQVDFLKEIREIYFQKGILVAYISVSDFRYLNQPYRLDELLKSIIRQYGFFSKPDKDESIDETDKDILKLLAENADIPIVEMANKLKHSPKTIIQRIKVLEQKKVIVAYKTFLDFEKLGYQHYKVSFILLKITKEKEREFRQYAKYHPNIIYEDTYIGGDDVEIGVHVKDQFELRKILDEIKNRFSDIIHDYTTLQIYEEHKDTYFIAEK